MNPNKNDETGHGLEDLGIAGQATLRDGLTQCIDPLKAIEGFQVSNQETVNIVECI